MAGCPGSTGDHGPQAHAASRDPSAQASCLPCSCHGPAFKTNDRKMRDRKIENGTGTIASWMAGEWNGRRMKDLFRRIIRKRAEFFPAAVWRSWTPQHAAPTERFPCCHSVSLSVCRQVCLRFVFFWSVQDLPARIVLLDEKLLRIIPVLN
jgi:hypothetical protein